VSIAVPLIYPGKQARIRSYEMLREAGKTACKIVCQAENFVDLE
jgi:hypothetical protein